MENQTALVTGASRGIGAAIAVELAARGWNVVINYLRSEQAAQSVAEQCRAYGVRAEVCAADVSDFEACKRLADFTAEAFGGIGALVNNAGVTADTLLPRMNEEQFDRVISGNLKAAFSMIRHVTPYMMKARRGRIVNLTSISGIYGNAGQANYAAAKAGIIGLTKSAAKELGGRNITVNAVAPGFIETDMTNVVSEKVREAAVSGSALKRTGKAADVAKAVAFLASEDAAFITGQVLQVDGGLVL